MLPVWNHKILRAQQPAAHHTAERLSLIRQLQIEVIPINRFGMPPP